MVFLGNEGPWQPLLEGSAADQAWHAIRAIAEDLVRWPEGTEGALAGPTLGYGWAGAALFFTYLDHEQPSQGHDDTAMECLEKTMLMTTEAVLPPALFSGFSGIGWLMKHLQGRLLDPEETESCDEIDVALQAYLDRTPWYGACDLIRGLAGFGLYALEGRTGPGAHGCLQRVLDRLLDTAQASPDGRTWITPPELLWDQPEAPSEQGWANLGLAHGVPGVVGFLAALCGAGVGGSEARDLLEDAVRWLLRQKLDDGTGGGPGAAAGRRFPSAVGDGVQPSPAPTAWGYGDPGIAAVLLLASRTLRREEWRHEAMNLALESTRRPLAATGVEDAGLLLGATGLAQVYARMYQATGHQELKAAAADWYQRALDLRRPGQGVGGFRARVRSQGEAGWRSEPGFLFGAAGIGLALLAAVSRAEPQWDRVLLVSSPN